MPIELLAPAGSPEALDAAIGEGADAVYLGLKNFNARMRSVNFTYARFEAALRALKRMGKKTYVTVNTVFEQREADRMYQFLKYLSSLGPDALIVQDFGVLAMIRSEFPKLKIHASTQMNIASARGANMLSRHGVSRVVLARELSLKELRSVREQTNMELEVFVHGALCVSASGLCMFSSYLGGKSANRGMCTQACRRLYNSGGSIEHENGYYFSPADLQLLEHLPDLAAAGVNAVKIEGRMKSADYVGAVVSAYRLVLDAMAEDPLNEEKIASSIARGQEILLGDFARKKTTFYFSNAAETGTASGWLDASQDGGTGISLGKIEKVKGRDGERMAFIAGTAIAPAAGDSIRLHRRDDSERESHKVKFAEAAKNGCWVSIPDGFDIGDKAYLIQTKAMSKRYKPVISNDAAASRRQPGHEKAPIPAATVLPKNKAAVFPEGLYAAVSRIEDLYIVQSIRPAKVMLSLTAKIARYLLNEGKQPLPFKPADIILVLDPYYPQAADSPDASNLLDERPFAETISELAGLGYYQFVVNNLGHFSLFRDIRDEATGLRQVRLIAGPWLYIFNTWALSFISSLDVDGFVSPLENNRQNLEKTVSTEMFQRLRSKFFVPVFAWPPLFRIRADLSSGKAGPAYRFRTFTDSRDEYFSLLCDTGGSTVIPEKPFSITDKIPFLKEAGFRHFIIDLSGPSLNKKSYRDLMRSAENAMPLPNISRFNWKDGFFTNEE